MDTQALLEFADIGSRLYVASVLVALGLICLRIARNDGILFSRLTWTWFCLALPFVVNVIGIAEEAFEILPNVELRCVVRNWMWLTHCVAGTAAWTFWSALNTQHPLAKP